MRGPTAWIATSLGFAIAGPILAWAIVLFRVLSGSQTSYADVALYPTVPLIAAVKAAGIEADETLFTLAAALGYGILPLLAWGGWTAWSACRRKESPSA